MERTHPVREAQPDARRHARAQGAATQATPEAGGAATRADARERAAIIGGIGAAGPRGVCGARRFGVPGVAAAGQAFSLLKKAAHADAREARP